MLSSSRSPIPLDPETELIKTEESYVNDLKVLVETFVIPLEKWLLNFDFSKPNKQSSEYCMELLSIEGNFHIVDALFSNIKVILQCNQLLLDSLHTAEKSGVEGSVVASFAKHAPYLKLYSQYTKNCQRATDLLTLLRADPRFSAFITCAELQKQCRGLNLQSFLIMPIQRGPRYELLLKEMRKHAKTTEQRNLIQKAIDVIVTVIKNIDSAVVGDEKREKLLELQDAFKISLAAPARYVVKCGDLKKICHSGKKNFFFVLCNDLILYGEEMIGMFTKNSKQRYKFHREYDLAAIYLVLISSDSKSFIIVGPDKAFEVEASTAEECSTWIELLIELKTVKRLNIHQENNLTTNKSIRVFRLWQIDPVVGNVKLAKFSIPDSLDLENGVILMDDLVPLEDEIITPENYRDSVTISTNISNNSLAVDRNSVLRQGYRSRGDSSLQAPISNRVASSRSKSVTTGSPSIIAPTIEQLKENSCSVESTKSNEEPLIDIFSAEQLIPTKIDSYPSLPSPQQLKLSEEIVAPPPRLHSVWSADFTDDNINQQNLHRNSLPRSRSSSSVQKNFESNDINNPYPTFQYTEGLDTVFQKRLSTSSSLSSSSSSTTATTISQPEMKSAHSFNDFSFSTRHSNNQTENYKPSFVEEDDLFAFLTSSDPITPSVNSNNNGNNNNNNNGSNSNNNGNNNTIINSEKRSEIQSIKKKSAELNDTFILCKQHPTSR